MKFNIDPETCQIHSIASEKNLPESSLNITGLKTRFTQTLAWQAENTDEHLMGMTSQWLDAAVLLPIVVREHGLQVLLTQRTSHLRDHAGQISFPGGRKEEGDHSPEMTALREAKEEIGLHSQHVEVLGCLPIYKTITGYAVTPVVALLQPPFELLPDANEVDEIFEVPFNFLMNPKHHQRRIIELPNGLGSRQFYAMPYQRHFIWGASAGMLRNLFHYLRVEKTDL